MIYMMSNVQLILVFLAFSGYVYFLLLLYTKKLIKKQENTLRNKVVVITGASAGIGEALAHQFYDEGSRVVLAARRVQELTRVKQDLMAKNQPDSIEPVVLHLDLNKHEECELFASKVEEICGPVDILVNNGAITSRGTHFGSNLDIHKRVMDVNYFGTVTLTNAFLKGMIQRQSGHIVIVGSVLGRMAVPYRGPYCASKHALIAFADSLRAELHEHNIKVSMILPGYVKTRISAKALDMSTGEEIGKLEKDSLTGSTPECVAKRLLTMVEKKEKEIVFCPARLSIGLFLRRHLPSVYFYVISNIRD